MTEDVTTMPQKKGSNGPTLIGQMELIFGDIDDGCAELACVLPLLAHIKRRVENAYLHGSRGHRRAEIVMDGIRAMSAPWDGTERRSNWRPEVVAA